MMSEHDDIEPGMTGNENDAAVLHYPFVRHLRLNWRRDQHGLWESVDFDGSRWEVVCTACGDGDGPTEEQVEEVRTLRGPYPSRHKAESAAKRHAHAWDPAIRWTPGSTIPLD